MSNKIDESAISFDKFKNYWENKFISQNYRHPNPSTDFMNLLRSIISKSSTLVLDHGCGSGRISKELAARGISIGLNDISVNALKRAIEIFEKYNLINMIAWKHVGSIEDWDGPVPINSFCSHRVLHTLPRHKRELAIQALSDYLRPGGKGLISAKSTGCKRFELLKIDNEFKMEIDSETTFIRLKPFRYIHYFTFPELENLLNKYKLKVIHSREFKEKTGNLQRSTETEINQYILVICEKIKSNSIYFGGNELS